MPPFRLVEASRAGPDALGILVPPGRRTVVIVRPRALDWDLLLLRPGPEREADPAFLEVGREEAAGLTQKLHRALEKGAAGASACVEAASSPEWQGYRVYAHVGKFTLVACPRVPGQPYHPVQFAASAEAEDAALRLTGVLFPLPDAGRELYVNLRNFSRPASPPPRPFPPRGKGNP